MAGVVTLGMETQAMVNGRTSNEDVETTFPAARWRRHGMASSLAQADLSTTKIDVNVLPGGVAMPSVSFAFDAPYDLASLDLLVDYDKDLLTFDVAATMLTIGSRTGDYYGGNALELAAAVRAVRQVDLESEASANTDLYAGNVVANTRLSNRVQLMRAGRPCAQPGSVGVCSDLSVSCAGPCGTADARAWYSTPAPHVWRHRTLHREHLLPDAWAQGNAVSTGRRL